MDNLHLLIVVILLSFGTGHAIFRSKFGFITLAFLSFFIYFIYFQIQGAQWSVIAITAFIFGVAYAYRESSEGMLEDLLYRTRELLTSIKSKLSFKRDTRNSKADSQSYDNADYQQAYEAEQARRKQEAKAQREKQKDRSEQDEEPRNKQEQSKQEKTEKKRSQNYHKQSESIEENKEPSDTRTNLEILGLKTGFTQDDLKKAYKRKTMKTHPDKWEQEPEHIQNMMEEEFKLVKKAFDVLKS